MTRTVRICATTDVEPESHMQVRTELGALAVYHVAGQFYVTADACTHLQGSLGEEGSLDGHVVECSWHNGRFDIRTGQVLAPPCTAPLKTYPVSVREGAVYITLPDA